MQRGGVGRQYQAVLGSSFGRQYQVASSGGFRGEIRGQCHSAAVLRVASAGGVGSVSWLHPAGVWWYWVKTLGGSVEPRVGRLR